MALDKFEVRVSIQKVLLGLILVIVPLSIVGLYLTQQSDGALDAALGNQLKVMAQVYSNEVRHQLDDRVSAVKLISADPSIVEAVMTANRGNRGQSESALTEKITRTDESWATPAAAPAVKALLSSRPSEILRHYRDMEPQIMRIVVTDEHGVPIAATAKPQRYALATNDTWQAAYAGGKGAADIGGILYDETTKSYVVDLAAPVTESGTGQLAGIALATINITPILAAFQQESIGNNMKAYLVDEDGTVVSGPKTDIFARVRSAEYGAVTDAMATSQGRQVAYVTANLRGDRHVIGFADTGLKKTYKNLGWTVLISQDERVATAPIRMLGQFATLMVILALFMLTLLAVYYALHRNQRFEDIEEALPHQGLTPPYAV